MRADFRLLTAMVVIGICGFSVARGFSIVHFSLDVASIDSSQKRADSSQKLAKFVNSWSSAPVVASRALQADLTYQIPPSDQKAADHRRQTLSALASIEPLSSSNWLSLSGLQLITDQPMEQVFDSLELSMLTGPNEGYLMAQRGIYGVSLWERLSPDLKRRVSADLTVDEYPDIQKIRAFVSTQPEALRNDLREALTATGLSPKEIERRLGN
jgi:hypothetical protein